MISGALLYLVSKACPGLVLWRFFCLVSLRKFCLLFNIVILVGMAQTMLDESVCKAQSVCGRDTTYFTLF